MRSRRFILSGCMSLFAVFVFMSPLAASETYVIKAEKIYTASNGVIENGWILVENGKISQVGKKISIPAGTKELTADIVIPGLVDMHSHVGVYTLPMVPENMDGNEATNPLTPEVRALDSFNFGDPELRTGLAGGVTTIVSRPGSANVIGGTSLALKLKNASPEEMIIKEPCDLKMTIEYNPILFHTAQNRMPSSLMTVYHLARKSFIDAQIYMRRWENYERKKKAGEEVSPPPRDLGKDHLVKALKKEIPVHVHVCTASEIMSAIRLADEFNLELSLAHVPCAYLIADELAGRKDVHFNVGCTPLFTYYQDNLKLKNVAAILAEAGLPVSLQADTVGEWQHNLLYLASLCVRYGMQEDDALKAITIHAAQGVHLDSAIGSIEQGKDADLVFLDGEPFEMTTSVRQVMIDGKIEYKNEKTPSSGFKTAIPDAEEPVEIPSEILNNSEKFAIIGGTVFTMAGSPQKGGIILVRNGKIEKIGDDISVPDGWPVIDARDYVVMPGLVNPRSYVGIGANWRMQQSMNETSNPVTPEMETRHAIDPQSPDFTFARQLGVTTAMVTPGNKNVIGGLGAIIKTTGSVADDMIIRDKAVMVFGLGNSVKRPNQPPMTRMGIAALLRESLTKAQRYREQKENEAQDDFSPANMDMEALLPVLSGEMPVMIHCERKDDIMTALRLADEFNLKLILTGMTDAYKAAEVLKKRNIPVILERVFRRTTYPDDNDFNPMNPALLAESGVPVAFKPEEGGLWVFPAVAWGGGDLLETAALAVKNGMPAEAALRAVTINAARIIGMDDRVGSLEPGKDADILILKGHPLRVRALPQAVFVEGKLVYHKEKGEHTS